MCQLGPSQIFYRRLPSRSALFLATHVADTAGFGRVIVSTEAKSDILQIFYRGQIFSQIFYIKIPLSLVRFSLNGSRQFSVISEVQGQDQGQGQKPEGRDLLKT
jgi:hypothetical protein